MRGDHLGAATHLRNLTTSADAYPIQIIPSAMARMQVAAASGDYTSVRLAAEPVVALAREVDIDQPGYWPWHDLYAHALVLAGRLDEAEELIGPAETRAERQGHRSTLARLGAVRARIAAVRRPTSASTCASAPASSRSATSAPWTGCPSWWPMPVGGPDSPKAGWGALRSAPKWTAAPG